MAIFTRADAVLLGLLFVAAACVESNPAFGPTASSGGADTGAASSAATASGSSGLASGDSSGAAACPDGEVCLGDEIIVFTGRDTRAVDVADFDGDGVLDFVTIYEGGGAVFFGDGDGTGFGQPALLGGGALFASTVVGHDLDGDGDADAVAPVSTSNEVAVHLSNGDRTMVAAVRYPSQGMQPAGLAVADFTGDGVPDVVVANEVSGEVVLLPGNGDGTLAGPLDTIIVPSQPFVVAAVDLAPDSGIALAVAGTTAPELAVALNSGGTFAASQTFDLASASDAVGADFDGDGNLDVAVPTGTPQELTVLRGDGSGNLAPQTPTPLPWLPLRAADGDLNADGCVDVVTASTAEEIAILLGNCDGTFTVSPLSMRPLRFGAAFDVVLADLDGNGRDDIVLGKADIVTGGVTVILSLR